jgi:hypothetical protein
MRLFLLVVPAALAAAFLIGRATATTTRHVWIGHQGDVLRVPAAATRCTVSAEGGFPDLFCSRIRRGRYTVTFYSDTIQVWRNGHPEKPAFSARWKP